MTKTELLKAERVKEREQKLAEKKRQQDYELAVALGEQYRLAVAKAAQYEIEAENFKKQVAELMQPYMIEGENLRFGNLMLWKQSLAASITGVAGTEAMNVIRKLMPEALKTRVDWELVRVNPTLMKHLNGLGIMVKKPMTYRLK